MTLAFNFFWLLPIPVCLYIAITMYRRKQHLSYPVFWTYLCFQSARISIEFFLNYVSYTAYFYTYWGFSFLSLIFNLLLLRTIFIGVLRTYPTLDRLRRIGYEIALGCVWCAALLLVFEMSPPEDFSRKIMRAELVVSFTAVGMFIFVVLACVVLGIKWRSGISGVAAGLGVLGTSDLAVYALWVRGGQVSAHELLASWVSTLAFDTAVGIFAFYFILCRVETGVAHTLRPDLIKWSESVRGAVSK